MRERFVLWPGDADRWLLPAQLKQYLRLSCVPVLLILRPLPNLADPCNGHPVEFPRNATWSLLGCSDATTMGVDVEGVVNFLAAHGETMIGNVRHESFARRRAGRALAFQGLMPASVACEPR